MDSEHEFRRGEPLIEGRTSCINKGVYMHDNRSEMNHGIGPMTANANMAFLKDMTDQVSRTAITDEEPPASIADETSLASVTDDDLYKRCRQYGANARLWTNKFAGLIPEVERRKLHRSHGYGSVYEFSAKLCGMTRQTVDEVLSLSQRLKGMPCLRRLLTTGKVGWTKLRIVAPVATPETDRLWANRVVSLSKRGLEALRGALRREAQRGRGDCPEDENAKHGMASRGRTASRS